MFSSCREKGISGETPLGSAHTHTAAVIVFPSAAIARGHHTVDPNLRLSCFLPGRDFVTPRAIPASNTLHHAVMSLGTDLPQRGRDAPPEDLKQGCPRRGPQTRAPRRKPTKKMHHNKKGTRKLGKTLH
ncbi:hypothetical protein Nmel_000550 [Mimus melanotis]